MREPQRIKPEFLSRHDCSQNQIGSKGAELVYFIVSYSTPCSDSHRSASSAAMQPVPAAVIACL